MAASPIAGLDLLCPQCTEIYVFPVLLQCGHNICKVCLKKFWDWKQTRECPVCGVMSVPTRPPINLPLKIAADQFKVNRGHDEDTCRLHNEKLEIFCQNDEEPICLACQTSRLHVVHECCSLEVAARQKRTEISEKLDWLKKKLKAMTKTKEQWEETKEYIKTQMQLTESEVKEEFKKLHQFLEDEEANHLKQLQQEEEVKTQVMCRKLEHIETQIKALRTVISDTERVLAEKDLPFLWDYKTTKKGVKCNIGDPECIRDILIDPAKNLGSLKFRIWKSMATAVQYVPVTLDPNTAHPNLKFSEELTQVQFCSKQPVPDNLERCTSRVCVLAAAGYVSGKHSWTVDVGQGKNWYIGVVSESIKRKTSVFPCPLEGFWIIGEQGDSLWAQTSPLTKLVLKTNPRQISIELDYDKGKVLFRNASDSTLIHKFKDKFTERIFPYFSPGLYDQDKIAHPLIICPRPLSEVDGRLGFKM
ncbi:E3 ubiquitin-protein ligase TRIM39-like [Neosynchiropus ocellatus]